MSSNQRTAILAIMFGLFFLIGVAALLVVLGFVKGADATFAKWAGGVLVVDIAAAVLAVFRTQFLGAERRVYVNLVFAGPGPVQVQLDECTFQVWDGNNEPKKRGNAPILKGPGGWQCHFALAAEPADTAELQLRDSSGRSWKVARFSPSTIALEAQPVN